MLPFSPLEERTHGPLLGAGDSPVWCGSPLLNQPGNPKSGKREEQRLLNDG